MKESQSLVKLYEMFCSVVLYNTLHTKKTPTYMDESFPTVEKNMWKLVKTCNFNHLCQS